VYLPVRSGSAGGSIPRAHSRPIIGVGSPRWRAKTGSALPDAAVVDARPRAAAAKNCATRILERRVHAARKHRNATRRLFMKLRKLALALAVPAALAATSLATAETTYGMQAFLSSPQMPQGATAYDCTRTPGHRAHVEAVMTALDSCGNRVRDTNGSQATSLEAWQAGQTQYSVLYNPSLIKGPCGMVSKQRATLMGHLTDNTTGEDSWTTYETGNVAAWTDLSQTASRTINTATSNTGACQLRQFVAESNGTIP
jgi:hypothetical protein